jgi:AcrR family transcriptional regulator
VGKVSAAPIKRLPRAVREQQMLDAAVKVFSRRGFHAASMDEIAEVAGISKPMVYAYLGTKDELFIACLRREATRLLEAVAGSVEPSATADQQLWNGLKAFFGFVGAHRDGWSVLYRQARGREPFAGELAGMRERIIEVVAGLLRTAFAGIPDEPPDFLPMAYALVGAAESLADWLADRPDEDPEATATRMMNFVWQGAGQLLRGQVWRPAGPATGSA